MRASNLKKKRNKKQRRVFVKWLITHVHILKLINNKLYL